MSSLPPTAYGELEALRDELPIVIPPKGAVVRPRCRWIGRSGKACGKLFAEYTTAPFRFRCPRCGKVTEQN